MVIEREERTENKSNTRSEITKSDPIYNTKLVEGNTSVFDSQSKTCVDTYPCPTGKDGSQLMERRAHTISSMLH